MTVPRHMHTDNVPSPSTFFLLWPISPVFTVMMGSKENVVKRSQHKFLQSEKYISLQTKPLLGCTDTIVEKPVAPT